MSVSTRGNKCGVMQLKWRINFLNERSHTDLYNFFVKVGIFPKRPTIIVILCVAISLAVNCDVVLCQRAAEADCWCSCTAGRLHAAFAFRWVRNLEEEGRRGSNYTSLPGSFGWLDKCVWICVLGACLTFILAGSESSKLTVLVRSNSVVGTIILQV